MAMSIDRANLAVDSNTATHCSQASSLPLTIQLLASGGDARILCDPANGQNQYGCASKPEPDILAFGSSTASTITPQSFDAAERLRLRLLRAARTEIPSVTYARELVRIRGELLGLCGLSDLPGLEAIFAASGTDVHLIAGQLAGNVTSSDLLTVMIDPAETGSGVPAALAGQHFSDCTAHGRGVTQVRLYSAELRAKSLSSPVVAKMARRALRPSSTRRWKRWSSMPSRLDGEYC